MVVSVIVIRGERSNALPISLFHDTVLDSLVLVTLFGLSSEELACMELAAAWDRCRAVTSRAKP
jgi:hypothetical protein